MIGMLDDILGGSDVKGLKGNIYALVYKKFSMGIIKAIFIIILSCYIYYFFNEEFWILKGIITALTTNLFNLFDLRPGRCIKFYYIFFITSRLPFWHYRLESCPIKSAERRFWSPAMPYLPLYTSDSP
jgi:hypothetical protein